MSRILTILCLLALTSTAFADLANGRKLVEEQCTKCHDDSVYTRANRFITDKTALRKQVDRCHLNTGAQWFDTDVDDVTSYLNETYYKFK